MEVTKNNFESIYPEIVKDIKSASFLCIDGEFTGLNNGHNVMAFDTPEETYLKIRAGAMDFLFIQFGLSIFTADKKTGKYKNKTYVFYLFPWHQNNQAPDVRFLCQTSSINFLVSNNFDFNKVFREGIPFLNSTEESNLVEVMETRRAYQASLSKDSPSQSPIPIPSQYKTIVDDAMNKIDRVVKGTAEEVTVEKQSGFVRKLIYQTFEQRYGKIEGVTLSTQSGTMVCRKGEEDKKATDAKLLEASVGFSHVIRQISASDCLVVGHNMLLDLCHMVHRFMDPLPSDYQDFKEMLHTLLPRLVDTKLMCSEEPLRSIVGTTTLEALLETISKPPFHLPALETEEAYSYKDDVGQLHNAGYDAYITGKVFLSLVRALDPDNKKMSIINCRPLEKYINKLYLMKAPDTCIDLVSDDPIPERDHVFHVTFPSSWTSSNIAKLFSVYGPIQVVWLNDTSAWVALQKREESGRAHDAFREKAKLPSGVTVMHYDRYQEKVKSGNSPHPGKRKATPPPQLKKKRKNSNNHNLSMDRSTKSPIPRKAASMKESEIEMLETAASFVDGMFDANASWD